MIKIGIIGCGKIAQVRHIPEYAGHPDAQLVAYYDLNQARAAELAKEYGGKAYASVEALLAQDEIDAGKCLHGHTPRTPRSLLPP
jgi:predicted dehydrogenase